LTGYDIIGEIGKGNVYSFYRNMSLLSGTQTAGSIVRAADILLCLSEAVHTVTDISRRCNLSKSTVHRVLKLLEQSQMVVEDTINRRYYLGPLVWQLTQNPITTHKRMIMCAADEMKHLSLVSGETVAMDVMSGINYYSLYEIPSRHDLKVAQGQKFTGPVSEVLYAGASAKVMLSLLNDERLNKILANIDIPQETEFTITDKALLMTQIKDIRKKGYAVSFGERILGGICISAPVKNYILPVALVVVGPDSRMQPKLKTHTDMLVNCAKRISENIADVFGETASYKTAGGQL
jgi:DNA-binding IclR family transcriptional regulator